MVVYEEICLVVLWTETLNKILIDNYFRISHKLVLKKDRNLTKFDCY